MSKHQDLRLIRGVQFGRMRMIISHGLHQITMRFVQVGPQNCSCSTDIITRISNQVSINNGYRCMCITRNRPKPTRIDLHNTKILRAVCILTNVANIASLYCLNNWKNAWRQMINRRHGHHAMQVGDSHSSIICSS